MTSERRSRGAGYTVRGRGRLTPEAVRRVRFRRARGLRGLNPKDVDYFVVQVSKDMASLYGELAEVYAENHRIKTALRAWQSEQARHASSGCDRPSP